MENVHQCRFPLPRNDASPIGCRHAPSGREVSADDPELLALLADLARWLVAPALPPRRVAPLVHIAAQEYALRADAGICVPAALLSGLSRLMQLDPYAAPPLSDSAAAALKGRPVPSWPTGEIHAGATWNELLEALACDRGEGDPP